MATGAARSRASGIFVAPHRHQSARRETELRLIIGELEALRRAAAEANTDAALDQDESPDEVTDASSQGAR